MVAIYQHSIRSCESNKTPILERVNYERNISLNYLHPIFAFIKSINLIAFDCYLFSLFKWMFQLAEIEYEPTFK